MALSSLIVACLWFGCPDPPPPAHTHEVAPQAVVQKAPDSTYRGMGSDTEQWRGLVEVYFPADQVDMALRVMACESGGNRFAANPNSAARGLMQIMASVWADEFGVTWDQLYDPDINLSIARKVYDIQGWKAWTCWR